MESNQVKIRPTYSPNPNRQENYILLCHSHAVRITVTAKPAVVRKWIYAALHRHRHRQRFQLREVRMVVGLGVQWAPERCDVPATLQLCVGRKCLIFQLGYAEQCPAVLRRFLLDTDVIFVGVRNYRDATMLEDSDHRLRVSRLVDLRHVASDERGISRGEDILEIPGMVKEEWIGRSNWDDAWLSEEQVKYATVDAFLSLLIGRELKVWKWVDDY